MLSRSDVAVPRSAIEAEYSQTRKDGAVFRFKVDIGAIDPEEAARRSRSAMGVVDDFCQRVLAGDEKPIADWDGIGAFDEWPCENEPMMYKYDIADDWGRMEVIIADRYLATCFRQKFCR